MTAQGARPFKATSPDGKLVLELTDGQFRLSHTQQTVLEMPAVGVTTTTRGGNLQFQKARKNKAVKVNYQMLSGKRRHCLNQANEYTFIYKDAAGKPVHLVARLFNDGLAFRYELSDLQDERLVSEQTTFRIAEGTRRWFQHWTDGYEDFFPPNTSGKVPEPWPFFDRRFDRKRWGYPALLQPADSLFALITEANIERQQSASSLKNEGAMTDYVVFLDKNEATLSGDWHTPWRVVIVGSLADVVQSTLVTDVSEPCQLQDTSWIHPGVVSWVYWANNHGSNDYEIIKKYVDLAATLHLPYVLIDAEWDEMKDGKTVEDAVNYAKQKGVKPMIWYNSTTGWINGAPGPKYRLNKPEDREKEFAWCERIGVAGVKIDFFAGDTQENMDYCIDLMESTARHHLLVNFHGATIPRGWQRTYPNLLSTEGVYGAEWYNNGPTFTKRAAAHNATLPFTRNVIGPMDYTPCAFSDSQHPHITSHAHELALTVLFESGLQHLADRPESFLSQPQQVQQFLSQLPAAWDETRLVRGYPGKDVVIARRSGNTWYVAGINGTEQACVLDIRALADIVPQTGSISCFLDGAEERSWQLKQQSSLPTYIHCLPRGGFVLVIR
ncbi:MAG: glycoside hydrolase family 97 protein [Bacteroidaceae bacterium]|nr:glycoside hydrolase family 97 protein [Bacteroidaceae bacterium]